MDDVKNAPPPPPLPPPQRSLNHHSNTSTPPCPGQAVEAAIPFAPHESEYPVQETNPTPGALPGTQTAQLTQEDEQAIGNLMDLGLNMSWDEVRQVYMACNKNAEVAADILIP